MDRIEENKLDAEKELTPEQLVEAEEAEATEQHLLRKAARENAVDGGEGARGGGMGASGSAVDFGRPKNYTGVDDNGL